jgi:hypothetical protein
MTNDDVRPPIKLSDEERARLAKAIVKEFFSQGGDYVALRLGWSILKKLGVIIGVGALALSWWLTHRAQP